MRLYLILCAYLLSLPVLAESLEYAQKHSLKSEVLGGERTIRVHLPSIYASNPHAAYPVIYVIRGQLDTLAVVASLDLLASEVPDFIVVGIDGGVGEFFPSKDGSQTKFSRFLHHEVIPHIEQTYKTAPYKVLVAHSMAGIFVLSDWFENGTSFSKYIAISPPLENGKLSEAAKAVPAAKLAKKNALLITIANEGPEAQTGFDELSDVLLEASDTTFKVFPEQTHMSTRASAIMHGLREEFPNWQPSKQVKEGDFSELKHHYENLSKRYGFEVAIPLDTLARMSGFGSWSDDSKKNKNAAAVVKYTIARNAKDVEELFDTAGQLTDLGAIEGNKRLVSYICNELPQDARCKKE